MVFFIPYTLSDRYSSETAFFLQLKVQQGVQQKF